MNYRYCVKQQIRLYIVSILSGSISYGVVRYFGGGSPIIITSGHIGAFIGGTLSYIFIFPLLLIWFNSLKK